MTKYVISILNYRTPDLSISCAKSALELLVSNEDELHVVIVNNDSQPFCCSNYANMNSVLDSIIPGDSANKYCCIVEAGENKGFARGTNVGFTWAKEKVNPDYFIAVNSDVVFVQGSLLERLDCLTKSPNMPDIIGPDIYNPFTGVHQNPVRSDVDEEGLYFFQELEKEKVALRKLTNAGFLLNTSLKLRQRNRVTDVLRRVKYRIKRDDDFWKYPISDTTLQGSCVIFAKSYIERMPWAFWPGTFMYSEEPLQLYISRKMGFCQQYEPTLKVHHLHGATTRKQNPNPIDHAIFFSRKRIESLESITSLINGEVGLFDDLCNH